jgi:TolB-like protein/Tfp pilus assembly protein PilF
MGDPIPKRFWDELLRRRVVRVALIYGAGAFAIAQAADLVLGAFDASHYTRFVIGGLIAGLPLALVLAWVFDITPSGIQRTPPRADPDERRQAAPERSIAVLPFANLSHEAENEYFSDGLSEEIRNQLAKVPGLRVAARTSSFAFKGRHEDVREIGRRLNVATVLEGGVRKQDETVRIYVQLVSANDGYQIWSENFERRLDDIFRLQSEVACAVTDAVSPRKPTETRAAPAPATQSFDAYNLYLLGRHHFHKRTEAALQRARECFEEAIRIDPGFALAYSGMADACTLSSVGYYGNMPEQESIDCALPAAQKAIELAPDLAEAHASLGLIYENKHDLESAERELSRALDLNPNYTMALVWHGLVLTAQGRYADAAARNREAFRLDPLSPIVNTNVGFDALRFGDLAESRTRFSAAMEIDPNFPVPYSGMSRLSASRGDIRDALLWLDRAIGVAPTRAYYYARRGLLLLQLGELDAASTALDTACGYSPENVLAAELVIALAIVRADRSTLERIARGDEHGYDLAQRGQAWIALGDLDAARALYGQTDIDMRRVIEDILTDDWMWRLPHIVNRAHLSIAAGDERGRRELEEFSALLEVPWTQGIINMGTLYLAASASAVLGRRERALELLEDAIDRGWRHAWWAQHDWNMRNVADDPKYQELLGRAGG